MVIIKPIDNSKIFKILVATISSILVAIIGTSVSFDDLYNIVFKGGLSNWLLVVLILLSSNFVVYCIMNISWKYDHDTLTKIITENAVLIKDLENENAVLRKALEEADILRETDIITGIPNSVALENDIAAKYFKTDKKKQCIFIDLQNFRKINKVYGFKKGNDLIKIIGRTIYDRMRRNEKMYKIPKNNKIYRVFPGGDEFVIIIFGEQWEALGFSNRVVDMFNEITTKTPNILGSSEELYFSCIIIEMKNDDSYEDLLYNIHPWYETAKEGGPGFTIYWFPQNIEKTINPEKDKIASKKLKEYEEARKKFKVMNPIDDEKMLMMITGEKK